MARRAATSPFPIPPPPIFDPHGPLSIREQCYAYLSRGLKGELEDSGIPAGQAETEKLRKLCREGNPFPLIAHQWPDLVITDPAVATYFEGKVNDKLNPCLRLDDWQRQIIAAFFDDLVAEIAVKGNTKAGKGTSVSIGVNLWFDVYRESKIVLTSQRFEHAVDVIFGEIAAWRSKMANPGFGRLTSAGLTDTTQHYITVANPKSGEGFSGQHGPRTLFCFDEATSVPDSYFDDATKQAKKIVALANPRTLYGRFRNLYKPCADPNLTQTINGDFGRRLCVTVDGANCMNVRHKRLETPKGPPGGIEIDGRRFEHNDRIPPEFFAKVATLIPNQCDYGRFMGICRHPDPRHVAVFAHGKFPTEDPEKQLILQSWLESHEKAWSIDSPPPVEAFGLDVARSLDGDATVFAAGGSAGVRALHRWKYNDITYHESRCLQIAREEYGIDLAAGRTPVVVDMDGLGAGLGDSLRRRGVWVIEFRGNATAQFDPRTYKNLRAEVYAMLGRRLNPDDAWRGKPWALPIDENLRQELTAPEKVYDADGLRFGITPKNKSPDHPDVVCIKDKIGRSPDSGDGVVYLFHAVRVLHNWDEWLREANRSLVVFPQPKEPQSLPPAPQNGERAKEDPTVAWLREQYGGLVAKDSRPPEELRAKLEQWKRENQPPPEQPEQQNGNGQNGNGHHAAGEEQPAAATPPRQETWLDRIKWDEE